MTAREDILSRIRRATADQPPAPPVPRDYRPAAGPGDPALFAERVADYGAGVHLAGGPIAAQLTAILRGRGLQRIVLPDGFPAGWQPELAIVREPVELDVLDQVSAVLTSCAVAIAETGTIVLDAGPGMGPRRLTLVPDYHLVVVRREQIAAQLPDAIAALDPVAPLTWISGPSATSDIELNRVEGVHGPRILDVLIV
ncbi:MAG TPA: LUD domain-containing protein [Jatrophihabitans sp.]|nr:LUD domain-containing protein [Jatrophihabitans sp.]